MTTRTSAPNSAEWPPDQCIPLSEASISSTLREQSIRTPDRAAIVEWVPGTTAGSDGEARSLTYAELDTTSSRVAQGLLTVAAVGDRIAVWAPNSIDWIVLEYAVARSGLVLVPLNPALTRSEAADLIRRSGCVMILASAEFRGRNLVDEALQIAAEHPCVMSVVEIGAATPAVGAGSSIEMPEPSLHEPFLIQYTSGTTGSPKGAVLSRRTALNIGVTTLPVMDIEEGAVWLNPLPLHHVGASVCGVFSALASGGTFVTVPSFDPRTVLHLVERTRATVLGSVPTTLMAMLDLPELARTDVSSLKVVQVGGSTVATSLIRRAENMLDARVVNAYGQSEAPSVSQTRLDDDDELKGNTIGRAGLHRALRIAHPVEGTTLGHDEVGELRVRTPLMMSGYFDDPANTAETIDGEGWLRTGDLCSMDADGYVTIHGRLRDLIIRGGENVYPAEVEDALLTHPAVADVAVVGAPDDRWGERVVAFVRLKPGAQLDEAGLDVYAEGVLARFKCPREWHVVDDFPLTSSGKVQKFRLREQLR